MRIPHLYGFEGFSLRISHQFRCKSGCIAKKNWCWFVNMQTEDFQILWGMVGSKTSTNRRQLTIGKRGFFKSSRKISDESHGSGLPNVTLRRVLILSSSSSRQIWLVGFLSFRKSPDPLRLKLKRKLTRGLHNEARLLKI